MLSLYIADDEPYVCALIRSLVDTEKLNLEIVGETYDGITANEFISTEQPDIAIVDIKMPGMDGLKIVENAAQANTKTVFLVVSGHKNFEYAHTALNLGVERYLLKPINEQELNEALAQITRQIVSENLTLEQSDNLQEELEKSTEINRKYLLSMMVNSSANESKLFAESVAVDQTLGFLYGKFCVAVIRLDGKVYYDSSQMEILLNRFLDYAEKHLIIRNGDFACVKYNEELYFLLNYCDFKEVETALNLLLDKARVSLFSHCSITIGISSEFYDIVSIEVQEAVLATQYRLVVGVDRIIHYANYSFPSDDYSVRETMKEDLFRMLEVSNDGGLNSWFERIRKDLIEATISPHHFYTYWIDICASVDEWVTRRVNGDSIVSSRILIAREIYGANTPALVLDRSESLIRQCFARYFDYLKGKESYYLRSAKKYVEEHYSEDFSLNDVANALFLNSSYFSSIFKKEEGITFSEYLLRYRLDQAKRLLKTHKYSVAQVSHMVGYSDARYFSKVFTKNVGVKPSEYRKLF